MIYLFNQLEELIDVIDEASLAEFTHTIELNQFDRSSFEIPVDYKPEIIKEAQFFGFQSRDRAFCLFRISEKSYDIGLTIEGIDRAESDLHSFIIEDKRPGGSADQVLSEILEDTGYQLGNVDGLTRTGRLSFYYISVRQALVKIIESYACEFKVRYTFVENKIIGRYIDLNQRFGRITGHQFEYGSNILNVTYEESSDDVVTALIGRGKGEESTNDSGEATGGYGRRIQFKDVSWSVSRGDPVDKPAGQNYVSNEAARNIYGLHQNGVIKHRFGVYTNEDIEDPVELLKATYKELQRLSVPIVTFKANLLDLSNAIEQDIWIGDSVAIVRDQIGIAFEARIHKLVIDKLNENRSVVELGDYQTLQAKDRSTRQQALKDAIGGLSESSIRQAIVAEVGRRDKEFDEKIRVKTLEFDNSMKLARSKAEEVKQELSDIINQRFDSFDNGPLKEAKRKAEEALKNAGASTLLAQEAKQIGSDSIAKLEEFKTQATSAQMTLSSDLDDLANEVLSKQEQIKDEVDEQVEALIQTKKELAGVKSAQAIYEESTTRRLSELTNLANGKASKSELTQTAEELASKIASVQVGGRNYIRGTRRMALASGLWTSGTFRPSGAGTAKTIDVPNSPATGFDKAIRLTSSNARDQIGIAQDRFEIMPGTYTISVWVKGSVGQRVKLQTYWEPDDATGISSYFILKDDKWTYLTFSSERKKAGTVSIGYVYLVNADAGEYLDVLAPQLENGSLATSPKEAPEDTDGQLSAVESTFKQRADSLDAGVRSLTEGLRTKADISALNVTAENIRQSVKSLETSTQNKLDQKLSQAEFEVQAGSIRQEILNATKDKADKTLVIAEAGKLREEFSQMKVGSRNYAEDYDFSRGLWVYSQGDSSPVDWKIINGEYNVKGTTNTWKQLQIHSKEGSRSSWKSSTALLDLEIGETYTLSFQAMCHSGNPSVWVSLRADRTVPGNPGIINGNFNLTSSWQTYQVTIPALTKPDNFDFWRIILGYDGIGHVAFRKVELTRSSTRIDAGPAPEDGKTDLVVAKSEFEKTAEGLSSKLATVETYISQDGQRQEALRRYTREESAKQATSVRELVTKDYVGKATYQEDVKGINQKIEAVKTSANKEIASQIASYRQSVDGKFTDISSQITTYKQDVGGQISGLSNRLTSSEQGTTTQISNLSNRINSNKQGTDNQISNLKTQVSANKDNAERQMGRISDQVSANKADADSQFSNVTNQLAQKVEITDFQRVQETSRLYERTIGSNENDITDKVARMAMTSQLFQVEVAKSLGSDNNLIVRSKSMDRHTLVNEGDTKRVFVNNGIFTIRCTGNSDYTFAGFTLPLYIDRLARGETYTLNFKYRIMVRLDHNFTVVAKNHQSNEGIFSSNIATSSTAVSSDWKEFNETYTISRDFEFGNSKLYPLYFYLAKNGWVEIKEIMLVRAIQTNGYKASQFDDMSEAVRSVQSQLAGSWAVQNIDSAGDLISGINLGANGHNRFDGKLTHITGETLIDKAVIKSAMIDKLKTANFEAGSVTTVVLDAEAVTAEKVKFDDAFIKRITAKDALIEGIISKQAFINHLNSITIDADRITGGNLSATNGAMKIDLNKGQYEVYTEKAAMRRVVAGYPNQFIKFDTGIQEVAGNRETKSGVTVIGSNSDGSENGNNQTFAGIQIWNNPQQRNVNSIGDYLRVSNKGFGENEKGWIIQTSDTPTIGPIVDKNKPETGKRSAILSGDFYFINKWGQKVSLLGILERFIVNFNTIKDKRGILYTDFSELN